jgi:hypothetical protein
MNARPTHREPGSRYQSQEQMEFATAVARLAHLLVSIQWPVEVAWIEPEHVLHFPTRAAIIFRPRSGDEGERRARRVFRDRYGAAPAILFYACGHDGTRTYAFVEALEELAQGEEMFVSDGLKISSQADGSKTYVTSSSFWWWFHRRSYRKWERRIARSLAGG